MADKPDDIVGHKTFADGHHEPLTRAEGEALWDAIEQNEARKAEQMPTSKEALHVMFDAFDRLRKLGWREGVHCPKDGSYFAVITFGSTGVFTGTYSGKWPDGYLIAEDCVMRPEGVMWKTVDALTEWEEAARMGSMEDTRKFIDRLGRMAESGAIPDDEPADG